EVWGAGERGGGGKGGERGGAGGEPVIKGASFLTLFATHVHTAAGPGSPTTPPVPQGESTTLSTAVLTKGEKRGPRRGSNERWRLNGAARHSPLPGFSVPSRSGGAPRGAPRPPPAPPATRR